MAEERQQVTTKEPQVTKEPQRVTSYKKPNESRSW